MGKEFNAPIGDFFNDSIEPEQADTAENGIKYRQDKSDLEVKTKRLNLVMQPTTLEHAKERADELGLSVNEYVHRLIKRDYKKREVK